MIFLSLFIETIYLEKPDNRVRNAQRQPGQPPGTRNFHSFKFQPIILKFDKPGPKSVDISGSITKCWR